MKLEPVVDLIDMYKGLLNDVSFWFQASFHVFHAYPQGSEIYIYIYNNISFFQLEKETYLPN